MSKKTGRPFNKKRNHQIAYLRLKGWTLKALSAEYGLSKARISQIVKAVEKRGDIELSTESVAEFKESASI